MPRLVHQCDQRGKGTAFCSIFRLILVLALLPSGTGAQTLEGTRADVLLLNGRIVRFADPPESALAIRNERILAIGSSAGMLRLRGPQTRVIDLQGRTVIPGLIDSHIHAIRAGLSYGIEVDWSQARSLAQALRILKTAARDKPPGSWLVVAGGWTESRFQERRRPTQAELASAAPRHHVYVQHMYDAILFSRGAFEALGVLRHPELASRLRVAQGPDGRPTGWYGADARTVSEVYDLLPQPDPAARIEGTRAFFRRLNSLGVTGVIDPGGYNLPLQAYEVVRGLWRRKALSLRVVYSLCAPQAGRELEDFKALTAQMPMGSGDDWLRFNGIGENVVWSMYNNDSPSETARAGLEQVLQWAAAQGLGATFHWNNERSVGHLLGVLEAIAKVQPLAPLRWSVAHLNDASQASLERMRRLGLGWLVQNALYFRGEELHQKNGPATREWPLIQEALALGVPVGMGTDAHRVMDYNPFVALQWLVDGRTAGGMELRPVHKNMTRLQALQSYTLGSAWFAHDELRRGALEAGYLADLAVLDQDYLEVPVSRIGQTRSVLTLVGGRIVYADGPFRALEKGVPGRP